MPPKISTRENSIDRLAAIIDFIIRTAKLCQIAGPLCLGLLSNKMCGFREGYALKNFNFINLKWATFCHFCLYYA